MLSNILVLPAPVIIRCSFDYNTMIIPQNSNNERIMYQLYTNYIRIIIGTGMPLVLLKQRV